MNKPPYNYFTKPDHSHKVLAIGITVAMVILAICRHCGAEPEYTDIQIVNALFVIEGGHKATYLYGIRSMPYNDETEARQICFNTVRNNRKRFTKQNKYTDFLEFLQSRYCPTSGKLSKAEQRLNGFWLKNLRKQLSKSRK